MEIEQLLVLSLIARHVEQSYERMMNLYVNIIMLKYPMIVEPNVSSAALYRFNPNAGEWSFTEPATTTLLNPHPNYKHPTAILLQSQIPLSKHWTVSIKEVKRKLS